MPTNTDVAQMVKVMTKPALHAARGNLTNQALGNLLSSPSSPRSELTTPPKPFPAKPASRLDSLAPNWLDRAGIAQGDSSLPAPLRRTYEANTR
ncbi:hypothetical protein AJ78_02875 [Emergomyces pasteurianus Ep9510]|uniref:Uncharacterized protein n=1 Tax=Emergomyces pasteurianus Ep9510 TaxID=1447872 RepID=A0A1J9PM80_9EURO|nr:hypothetical protein AJ78_02875 [Emergomyces pasteurianus Ep9510]